MESNTDTAQMKVYVTPEINKVKFQVLCTENRTDMTKAINKYIALCLTENKLIV